MLSPFLQPTQTLPVPQFWWDLKDPGAHWPCPYPTLCLPWVTDGRIFPLQSSTRRKVTLRTPRPGPLS